MIKDLTKIIILLLLLGSIGFGYILNIVKLCQTDFKPSYKEEIIRTVGIPFAPVGVIVGYIDFEK